MDDIREIENKVLIAERETDNAPSPDAPVCDGATDVIVADAPIQPTERVQDYGSAPVSVDLASPAVLEAAKASMDKARNLVNNPKKIDKYAKDLSDIAGAMVENQLDTERLKTEKEASKNKVERAKIANDLYEARQEGIRLRKEAKHQSAMQKARHKTEKRSAYWEAHKATLEQYGMHEGSSRASCEILRFLDGVKGFFIGISKVSDALLKALRWILIFIAITAGLMIIPVTRNWILTLLGFIE